MSKFTCLLDDLGLGKRDVGHYYYYEEDGNGVFGDIREKLHKMNSALGKIPGLETEDKKLQGQISALQSQLSTLNKNSEQAKQYLSNIQQLVFTRLKALEEHLNIELVDEQTDSSAKTFYRKLK